MYYSLERVGRFKEALPGPQRGYQRGLDGRDVESFKSEEDAGVRMGDHR